MQIDRQTYSQPHQQSNRKMKIKTNKLVNRDLKKKKIKI